MEDYNKRKRADFFLLLLGMLSEDDEKEREKMVADYLNGTLRVKTADYYRTAWSKHYRHW